MRHPLYPRATLKAAVIIAAWAFLQVRTARAENSVSYKYVDYREDDDRITVKSQYGLVQQDLGTDMHLKLEGVIDAIAGATPTGQAPKHPGDPVPLSEMHDRRKAWSADLSRQFPGVTADVGFANSRESDYVSNGGSLNTLFDFNQKNTTLLLGAAATEDRVRVFYQDPWAHKHTADFIVGITQLLDPQTSVTANLSFGHSAGYLGDPYRVVQQITEVQPGVFLPLTFPENRPTTRDRWTFFTAINRSFPAAHGALEGSYRFFHDTFGTDAHTFEVAWYQKFGDHFTLRPNLRYYDQNAASFYRIDITGANFNPTGDPMPNGPFYSADYRLSAFRSYDYGLKLIWTVTSRWQVDLAYDRYEMHGKDNITSPTAYPKARTTTAGIQFSW